MPFSATDIAIPEDLARDTIAALQSWRAIVADPDAAYEDLEAAIAAGGIAAGEAADRICYGLLEEDCEHPDWRARPRMSLRQLEDETWNRQGGFVLQGMLLADVEFPVPSLLRGRDGLAILDGRRKVWALAAELLNRPAVAGWLNITSLGIGPVGLSDPTEEGVETRFVVTDFFFRFDGAA